MTADLRAELLCCTERDQAARRTPGPEWDVVASVDAGNLARLKEVVSEVGWPGKSMVGEDGAHAAWLLAQHADSDPAFQRRCLDLVTDAVVCGEAVPAELAYLTDRVLLAEGKPQEYGTQFEAREGRWVPQRLRDPERVDERRAAMGLGTLAENTARIAAEYGPPKPASITCARCGGSIEVWPLDEGETRQIRCAACGWTATLTDRQSASRSRMILKGMTLAPEHDRRTLTGLRCEYRWEAPVRPESEAQAAAAALRASRADRERVIDLLKTAFVQGRLDRDEFDARIGQAVASRTYGELAAVTADIPAELIGALPRGRPVRARRRIPFNTAVTGGACMAGLMNVGMMAVLLIRSPVAVVLFVVFTILGTILAIGAMIAAP